jgi:hypothetical protein
VLENGVVVGRIFKAQVAPQDRPWMWASGHNEDIKRAAYGYERPARLRWRRSRNHGDGGEKGYTGSGRGCPCRPPCLLI